jgi:hypothetical protein
MAGYPPTEMWVIIRGFEGANLVHDAFSAERGAREVGKPAAVGKGWWCITAIADYPISAAAEEAVRSARAALVCCGDGAEVAAIDLYEDGAANKLVAGHPFDQLGDMFARAETSPALASWSVRNAPRPLTNRAAHRFWADLEGASGREICEALVQRLGRRTAKRFKPWQLLGECTGAFPPPRDLTFAGEIRVDWDTTRFVVGFGDGFVGAWDRDAPEQPMIRWRLSPQSSGLVHEFLVERVFRPIIQSTELSGDRFWAPLQGYREAPAAVAHWRLDRAAMSVILAMDPPVTESVSQPGTVALSTVAIERYGLAREGTILPIGVTLFQPLASVDDVTWAATVVVWGSISGNWQQVPDHVERSLEGTVRWVRSRTM